MLLFAPETWCVSSIVNQCWRAMLPLMGVGFLRGATFPEAGPGRLRSGLDSALRAHDPHANRQITFSMTLVSPCGGLGKVTADTRVKGRAADDKVQVDTA